MTVINGVFWQNIRPDGYRIVRENGVDLISRREDVHTTDMFEPVPEFFTTLGNEKPEALAFVNQYGSLWGDSADGDLVKDIESELNAIHDFVIKLPTDAWEIEEEIANNYLAGTHLALKKDTDKVYKFSYVPENLLAQMWLNIILYVTGQKSFKQCEYEKCSIWFEVPLDKVGNPQRFCKDSHRVAQHRILKKELENVEIDESILEEELEKTLKKVEEMKQKKSIKKAS